MATDADDVVGGACARMRGMRRVTIALAGALLAILIISPAAAQTGPYASGELFVSVGGGIIRVLIRQGPRSRSRTQRPEARKWATFASATGSCTR